MEVLAPDELERRRLIANQYAELPRGQRGEYAESLGINRRTMLYWLMHYSDYKDGRPSSGCTRVRRAREMKVPEQVRRLWYIQDIALRREMREAEFFVRDIADRKAVIETKAEFVNGAFSKRIVEKVADKLVEIVTSWGYEVTKEEAVLQIKGNWL